MNAKTNPQKDHGCSCGRPSCRYDAHYGNPLREVEAQTKTNPLAVMDGITGILLARGHITNADQNNVARAAVAELVETNERIARHLEEAVKFIDAKYPGAPMLDRGPILNNMRRWSAKLRAALAAFGDEP